MPKLIHHYEPMTPEKRQAIKLTDAEGRSCIYVPIKENGAVVDSKGYELIRDDTDNWGFAIRCLGAYAWLMPSKPIELPPDVAKAFVRDMLAFFAAGGTGAKADGIATMQLHLLKQHYPGKLKLHDVKELFLQMKDQG